MIVFLDTEFTDLQTPLLLSIGLVTMDGREFYVELDLSTAAGQARLKLASDFVRDEFGGVIGQWGKIEGAATTEVEMGRLAGEWLLALATDDPLEIAFDYPTDASLFIGALRGAQMCDVVNQVLRLVNIAELTSCIESQIAAEGCFYALESRGIQRHHALADAIALRAAYVAAKRVAINGAFDSRLEATK